MVADCEAQKERKCKPREWLYYKGLGLLPGATEQGARGL